MSAIEDDPNETAAGLGLTVIEPLPDEVLVDIDSAEDLVVLHAQMEVLGMNGFPLVMMCRTISKSAGERCHVYLRAPRPLTDMERVLLQSILGSDRRREALAFLRMEQMTDRKPSVLFERPDGVEAVQLARAGP